MMISSNHDQLVIHRVAVVGSGISGLTVAHRLTERGIAASLFEKSRGPGGRLAAKRLPGGSVDIGAQYFTLRNPRFREFLQAHAKSSYGPWRGRLRYQTTDGDWEDMTPEDRFVGQPRMTAISRALSKGLDLALETPVAQLVRDSGQWQLFDEAQKSLGTFDAVILTAPPDQTCRILEHSGLETVAGKLLPYRDTMLPCWTVVASFQQPLALDFDGAKCKGPILDWVANNASKPGRKKSPEWWVLHGAPGWSANHVDTPGDEVAGQLLEAFRETFGVTCPLDRVVTHRWLYARPAHSTGPGHLWFPDLAIGMTGDWLRGGRVEGAFDSAESLIAAWESSGVIPAARPHGGGDRNG